jgi:Ring finger domain
MEPSLPDHVKVKLLATKIVLKRCGELLTSSANSSNRNYDVLGDIRQRLIGRVVHLRSTLDARESECPLSDVDDVATISTVLLCSSCRLLQCDEEGENAIVVARLAQYLPQVSTAIATFEAEFRAACEVVRGLHLQQTRSSESNDDNPGKLWERLTVESIDRILPSKEASLQPQGVLISSTWCSICMESYSSDSLTRLLPRCHHMFHKHCIDQWFTNGNVFYAELGHRCPNCRQLLYDHR